MRSSRRNRLYTQGHIVEQSTQHTMFSVKQLLLHAFEQSVKQSNNIRNSVNAAHCTTVNTNCQQAIVLKAYCTTDIIAHTKRCKTVITTYCTTVITAYRETL